MVVLLTHISPIPTESDSRNSQKHMENPLLIEEVQNVARKIGREKIEKAFCRTCYNLLKTLQDTVARSADDMIYVFEKGPHGPLEHPHPLRQLADGLISAMTEFKAHELKAEVFMENLYAASSQIDRSLSQDMEH